LVYFRIWEYVEVVRREWSGQPVSQPVHSHSLTHSLTPPAFTKILLRSQLSSHSLTHSLTHTLTHSRHPHPPTHSLTHPAHSSLTLTHSLTHSLPPFQRTHTAHSLSVLHCFVVVLCIWPLSSLFSKPPVNAVFLQSVLIIFSCVQLYVLVF